MRTPVLMLVMGLGLVVCATTAPVARSEGQPQSAEESQPAELSPRVSAYLTAIVALEPPLLVPRLEFPTTGSLPGWRDRVCPQVTGLPEQEGKLILARISEIGRVAGVRMAAEHCSPNLNVYVTSQPKELLEAMQKRNSFDMFGPRGMPHLLNPFIDTARPVRVWYNIYGRGRPVSFRFAFTRVVVVVDQTRLQGVSPGQLADYIAMVGFAEIKPLAEIRPGAPLGDAPTILKLFDAAQGTAPTGLSDWDQAFLKSLYANSRVTPWTRQFARNDQLTLRMVSEIAH
jgi:hypothetical protein